MGTYDRFKSMFEKYSQEAGKKQYLIPYFISAHPGTEDEDMLNLAMWLKKNNLECDQVQNFYPSPMCNATSMYYSETNPLKRVKYKKREDVTVAKGERQRRLHKGLLRYHDPKNWKMIREALTEMGKKHLIGDKPHCLVPEDDIDTQTPAERRQTGRHGAKRYLQLSILKHSLMVTHVIVTTVAAKIRITITVSLALKVKVKVKNAMVMLENLVEIRVQISQHQADKKMAFVMVTQIINQVVMANLKRLAVTSLRVINQLRISQAVLMLNVNQSTVN